MQRFLSYLLLTQLAACATTSIAMADEDQARPNIVMILSDDQAWTDYGFMGHPDIQTPHLDRLASRSAVFRRGYTSVPLCRPSLMSMITGRYPHTHRVTGNDPGPNPKLSETQSAALKEQLISSVDSQLTIPRALAPRGYLSMQSGKWWEGNFTRGGFTHGMTRGFPQPGGRHGDDGLEIGRKGMQPVFDFIKTARAARQPFFLWYAPMLPHTPHDPPDRLLKKYRQEGRLEALARYFAMCEFFDETCGQVLDHLEQEQLAENTIVVYVTDNGWIQSTPEMNLGKEWNHGFAPRSKQTVYEGGIRTPILLSWPGTITPSERSELASTLDVFPTLLAAVGAEIPKDLPGLNLLPMLQDQTPVPRTVLFGESFSHDIVDLNDPEASLQYRCCIERQWKLILSYDCPPDRYAFVHSVIERQPQLFDLQADPHEEHNLAAAHPELVRKMSNMLQQEWSVSKAPVGLN